MRGAEGVLFYSDGLVEAHNPKGEMFGFPRLRSFVAEHGEESSLEEALLESLRCSGAVPIPRGAPDSTQASL